MRSRAKKLGGSALNAAALHWITYFGHVHGETPRNPSLLGERAQTALRDIVLVQCHGDTDRALSLIEEIVEAPLWSTSLEQRYVDFWAWIEHGSLMRVDIGVPSRLARDIRACIAANVAGVAA